MLCKDLMTPNPKFCSDTTSAQAAAELMKEMDIGIVPIVDVMSGKLKGIVTDRDLCLEFVANGKNPKDTMLSDVMTENPITCYPYDEDQVAQEKMKNFQVRRIPIVDEDGVFIGVISQRDLALKLGQSEEVHETLREISSVRM